MSLLTQILPKKEGTNYFILLGLEENIVRAAVGEISDSKVRILGTGKSEFADEKNETEAVDMAISMAEKSLPEEILPENVIFALPQFYLEGTNVKEEYLKRLKKISKELNLKAEGFVDYASAISYYLDNEEGAPPTVLLFDLTKNHLTITLIRIGKISQHVIVDRTDSIVSDFSGALPEFKAEILPSRIILYDGAEKIDEIKEELLRFPWHKHSIFLHTTKIEILSNDKILKSIIEAASTTFLPKPDALIQMKQSYNPEDTGEKETVTENPPKIGETQKIVGDENDKAPDTDNENKQNFGFVSETLAEKAEKFKRETSPYSERSGRKNGHEAPIDIGAISGQIITKFNNIKGVFYLVPLVLLIFVAYLFILNYPRASVSLITYPRPYDQTLDIVFSQEAGAGDDLPLILTRTVKGEAGGEKSAKTTGKNQIGEKAKGEISIYNKTLSSKQLPKGTILQTGPLKFTLDGDVKIASATETGEGINFGKASAKVIAAVIGPEGNLAANSNFTVVDFSDSTLTAKNSQPFSGGTSREIASISREDRDNLEEKLMTELVNKAKQSLVKELSSGERLLETPISTEISAKKFSGEAGSEAEKLNLSMTLTVEAQVFKQNELEKLAEENKLSAIAGYTLDKDKVSFRVLESVIEKDGSIKAKVKLVSYFIPDLDMGKIKKDLKGKTYDGAVSYLEKIENIAGVKISVIRKLPLFNKRLPYLPDNISVSLVSR